MSRPTLRVLLLLSGAGLLVLLAVVAFIRYSLLPDLPPTSSLRELQLEQPLRVYTRDGKLIGEFGAERRAPVAYADIPEQVIQAFLASEDDRFFEHPGVDWQGLVRAMGSLVLTGEKRQGGSTITMQLARNVFLSNERTYLRKAREILLALQIERDLGKQEILELYLNKIYLGNRAYGVGAAARVYFDRDLKDLDLSQVAVLAGLPKAPSRDNPFANPDRARERRDYVLRRMRELGYINDLDYQAALAEVVAVRPERPPAETEAHYVAEMVRADLFERYGEAAYRDGYRVITTIDSAMQDAANNALRTALVDYGERHEYPGPEGHLPPEALDESGAPDAERIADTLDALPPLVNLTPSVVVDFSVPPKPAEPKLRVLTRDRQLLEIKPDGFAWAQLKDGALKRGDIIRIRMAAGEWRLSMAPRVQGALVGVQPSDGAIQALIGGYDFFEGKFNRVTQARRQAGSGFKPFLYTAAMAFGFTPASVILDAPVVFDDPALEDTWRPENYTGKFYGPTRLREALVHSRNLVSIRLLLATGIGYARQFIQQFGLPLDRMPGDLTLALGSASFTPLEMARAYCVIANGGFLIDPYYIVEIQRATGESLFKAEPRRACPSCAETQIADAARDAPESAEVVGTLAPRVVEPRLIYLIRDMLRDVVQRGTAAKTTELGRGDLAGKTGTTNDEADAWFSGFQSDVVAISWVGFDQPQPLGRGEVGGRAALPMWMDFMRVALKGVPESWPERPPGLVSVRVNRETGKLAPAGDTDAIFEIVQAEHTPGPDSDAPAEGESEKAKVDDLY